MIDYTEDHFRSLCSAPPVAQELSTLEERRTAAIRKFWLRLVGTIVFTAALLLSLAGAGWFGVGLFVSIVVFLFGLGWALAPLSKIGADLKAPVLETLARDGGLTWLATGFDPPVYPDARQALFGTYLSSQTFTDLFHGVDEQGRRFAICEGSLRRRSGKNTVTVFSGQLYAWQRRARGGREIVIVPDSGIFNFFKPLSGMERVRFEGEALFEQRFEVYAYEPHQALMTVNPELRRILLELRIPGRVFAWIGPEDVLVAVTGKDRFEAGSMLKKTAGQQRIRAMFDDVCASLATLKRLRGALP